MTAPSAGRLLLPDYCRTAAEAVISPPVYQRLFKFHLFPTVDVMFSRFSSGGTREPTSDRQKQPMQEFGWDFFVFFCPTTKIPPRKNNLRPLIIRMRSSFMVTDWPDKKKNRSEISQDNICIVEPLGPSPLAHWPLSPPASFSFAYLPVHDNAALIVPPEGRTKKKTPFISQKCFTKAKCSLKMPPVMSQRAPSLLKVSVHTRLADRCFAAAL